MLTSSNKLAWWIEKLVSPHTSYLLRIFLANLYLGQIGTRYATCFPASEHSKESSPLLRFDVLTIEAIKEGEEVEDSKGEMEVQEVQMCQKKKAMKC